MQIEIKCALEFLLSYLYDKLPRRRVNLFGDELEKYLKLKLIASNSNICLNINYNQNGIDLIDPCLIVASKESAIDLKEILECWPTRLKLFIENGRVSYSLDQDLNQEESLCNQKTIYNEKNESLSVSPKKETNYNKNNLIQPIQENQFLDLLQMGNKSINNNLFDLNKLKSQNQQNQNHRNMINNNNLNSNINKTFFTSNTINCPENNTNNSNNIIKSRGLNLNFNNLKPSNNMNSNMAVFHSPTNPCALNNNVPFETAPYFNQQNDFSSFSPSSPSPSSSSSHLSNQVEDSITNHYQQQQNINFTNNTPNLLSSNVAILTANSKAASANIGGNNSMFTTAAFAQTKFGSTKTKNTYNRQTKQQKMLPNEFNSYIRNKIRTIDSDKSVSSGYHQATDTNLIDFLYLNEQVPSISFSSYNSPISPTNHESSFFKNNINNSVFQNSENHESQENNMPYSLAFTSNDDNSSNFNSVISRFSPLLQPELLITNSTVNEIEENMINNYFGSPFSSPSSSTVSSASSSSSSYYTGEISNKPNQDMLNPAINDFISQINNLTI